MAKSKKEQATEELLGRPKGDTRIPWKDRKRVVIATLLFCAFCVLYILLDGTDSRIYETIALGCFGLAGSVVGFYVAGATYHDVNTEKIKAIASLNDTPAPKKQTPNTSEK